MNLKNNFRKRKFTNNGGITLIALVITIIVLLILAGVSITMLSGDNSILSRAGQAKERTEFAKVKEEIALAQAEAVGNHYLGDSSKTIEAQILEKLTAAGYTIGSENSGTIQDISLSSNSVTIEEGGNTTEVTATLNTSGGSTNYVLINGLYYPLNKKQMET